MEPTEMMLQNIYNEIKECRTDIKDNAAKCSTVCVDKFASKEDVQDMQKDLKLVTKKTWQIGAAIMAGMAIITVLATIFGPVIAKHF